LLEFSHGGGIEAFAKELNYNVDEIIDLSSNINFIKPKINLDFNSLDISAYPTYDKLYKAIADNYKININQLELFNGGSSAIFTLFKHLNLESCTIYSPAYLEYKKATKKFNYKLHLINRLESLNQEVEKNSLVIFVNPSTPDGAFYNIKELLNYWHSKNCTVLVDESFLDFTEEISVIKYLNQYPKLYILKSMTKFYSSAGIRIGTIVSNAENIKTLKEKEPLWKLSQFDSHYLQESLKDKEFKELAKEENNKARKLLQTILENSPLFKKVYKTTANYFLVELNSLNASELQELLKPYKIMVRDCSNFDFLNGAHVRISVKSKKNLTILQEAISIISTKFNLKLINKSE